MRFLYFISIVKKLSNSKKIYFISDIHLGAPNSKESLIREQSLVRFLESIKNETSELFLVGDIFDFWFDYNTVVPKGYVRLLGKLAEFADLGIKIHYFKGNHDMWIDDYFKTELNCQIHSDNFTFTKNNLLFLIGHGDGKGPNDNGYKRLKKIFRNPICQWLLNGYILILVWL